MGRGKGGSVLNNKRAPGGIRTTSKMSKVGEIEAKDGVLGGEQTPGAPDRVEGSFVDSAKNLAAKKLDGQKGSNPGGTFESAAGEKNYLKMYKEPGQAYGEAVANNIYNALGLKAPKSVMFDPKNPDKAQVGSGVANGYMDGTILYRHGVDPEIADKILDGAAADILLANWDTVGLVNDNILVDENKDPVRIDNGGSLLYRAQGAPKPNSLLNKISEWDVFSNDGSNGRPGNESYANIIKAAGHSSFDDIMPRMKEQVEKINQVAADSNDFEDLVPEASGVDEKQRSQILEMLRSRRDLLNQKVGADPSSSIDKAPAMKASKDVEQGVANDAASPKPYVINSAQEFHDAIDKAKQDGREEDIKNGTFGTKNAKWNGAFVDTYPVDQYEDLQKIGLANGGAGIAVKKNGDIVSVFKNPKLKVKDAMSTLMPEAISRGGDHLDCFNGYLPGAYSLYGMKPVARLAFNRDYAPDGWNYERDGEPEVIFMAHDGRSIDQIKSDVQKMREMTSAERREYRTKANEEAQQAVKKSPEVFSYEEGEAKQMAFLGRDVDKKE